MSKETKKNTGENSKKDKSNPNPRKQETRAKTNDNYLFRMSHASALEETTHWFQMLPALFFTSIVIMIVRMTSYKRPMGQFSFMSEQSGNDLNDFFSYYKMMAIIICAAIVLLIILYKVFVQALYVKRSFAYIPILVYTVFVLLSYFFSDYKLFALWGWNDRFEGTLVLLSYMVMLFYIINCVSSEKNVKWIINLLAVVSAVLGILGVTQALNHDFFRTAAGKKLITPSWFWEHVDTLDFTFTNQIYQTVYNINYVSFYLTLLIPIFGILFVRSMMQGKDEPVYKKMVWGALFTLLVYNLIGSASSGGLMGMAFVVLIGIIVLNKNILKWWKPVAILLILTIIVAGVSVDRWMPEMTNAVDGVSGKQAQQTEAAGVRHKIDYMETAGNDIRLAYKGDELTFRTYPEDPASLTVTDPDGTVLALARNDDKDYPEYKIQDLRFDWIAVRPARDDAGNDYIVLVTDDQEWPFKIAAEGLKYRTGLGRFIDLQKISAVGWEYNQEFGSGRGYIWSRTIPMLKDTVILGHGADTYCIFFPHEDYVGKYNSGTFSNSINMLVDKPHNMYMGVITGTGGISMLALLALWGIYIVQSFNIYRKQRYSGYLSYVGAGIFLGICGFLVSALVNDSSVSVMPMFYGLLGTGIAINMMLRNNKSAKD